VTLDPRFAILPPVDTREGFLALTEILQLDPLINSGLVITGQVKRKMEWNAIEGQGAV
jgi:hypothetical protein